MNFYHQLKQIRVRQGFSIREVAKRSGVSAAYISQLENGNRGIPSPDILQKLSSGLNTSYSTLMEHAGYLQLREQQFPYAARPLYLRDLLHQQELVWGERLLTEDEKIRIEKILDALFWKGEQS